MSIPKVMSSNEDAKDAVQLIQCTYLPKHPIYGHRIRMEGLTPQVINEVIREVRPLALTHSYSGETGEGHASFVVTDEKDARKKVDELNKRLVDYGYCIDDLIIQK